MTNLGSFFEGQARARVEDRAFWEQFAAFGTCSVEHVSGGKCVLSPRHGGRHVLAPAEGETSIRYFTRREAVRRSRPWSRMLPLPRNVGPRKSDCVLTGRQT